MALNEHDMSGPERDPRLDGLYAQAVREEPPAHLDAAIRAAARKAVGARPRALGAWFWRWGVPVSIAAVVVVSVSLVTLMREEGAGRIEESYAPAPAEPKASAPAPPAVAPVDARDRAAPSAGDGQVASPQAPAAPEERAPGDVDRAAARQAAPEREVLGKKETEPRTTGVPSEPAAALRSAPFRADQESLTAPTREKSERSLTSDQAALLKALEKAAPESWFETIERLRREGWHADADALLLEFKRRFPQHPASRQETELAR